MDWRKMAEHNQPESSAGAGHELSDLNPRNIALFGATLALVIGATLLAAYGLFYFFYTGVTKSRPLPSPLSYSREPTPEPRLLIKPGDEMQAVRTEESKILNSYDWVDRDKGIVRIPIDRAMEILGQRRLPVRSEKNDAIAARQPAPRRKETGKR
jgi:hypothetical protein